MKFKSIFDLLEVFPTEQSYKAIAKSYIFVKWDTNIVSLQYKSYIIMSTYDYLFRGVPFDEMYYLQDGGGIYDEDCGCHNNNVLQSYAEGGQVWQKWQRATGLPWKEARAMGLTDGSYDKNIQLEKLIDSGQINDYLYARSKKTVKVSGKGASKNGGIFISQQQVKIGYPPTN